LVGLPPLAGFISKFLLFYGVLQAGISGDTWIIALVVGGVLNSALSLYYYLKVIRYMYLYDPEDVNEVQFSNSIRYVSFFTILFLVFIIPLFYQDFYSLCEQASAALFA
jgi:NADH-quinone oxidoreductase subunit N